MEFDILDNAINGIFEGTALLFTGAGYSFGALNILGQPILGAGELSEFLLNECGLEKDTDLKYASAQYKEQYGSHRLIKLLRDLYTISVPSEDHFFISSLEWNRIYTTNYDDLFEKAAEKSRIKITPIDLNSRCKDYVDKSHISIHINGFINALNHNTLDNSFKLSEQSFFTSSFADNEWSSVFRTDVAESDYVIFIGHSLNYDLDIARILNSITNHDKIIFISSVNEQPRNIFRLNQLGHCFPIGLSGFVNRIRDLKKSFVPKPKSLEYYYKSYYCHKFVNYKFEKITGDNIFDLLFYGKVREDYIYNSYFVDSIDAQYVIPRRKLTERIVTNMFSKKKKVFIIHSDLGNGKTVFSKTIKHVLLKEGFVVFERKENTPFNSKDLEQIALNSKRAVLIENFHRYISEIKEIVKYLPEDTKYIFTSRSVFCEVGLEQLTDSHAFDLSEINVYDINKLDNDDIILAMEILSKHGFWREFANLWPEKKQKLLTSKCNSEISSILMMILKSDTIKKKLRELVSDISFNRVYVNIIYTILLLNIIGEEIDFDDYPDFVNAEIINSAEFRNNNVVKQLVDFKYNTISFKSPILAQVIMGQLNDITQVIEALTNLAKRTAEKNYHGKYDKLQKSLTLYSNMQLIMKDFGQVGKYAEKYYENIKGLSFTKANHCFGYSFQLLSLILGILIIAKLV